MTAALLTPDATVTLYSLIALILEKKIQPETPPESPGGWVRLIHFLAKVNLDLNWPVAFIAWVSISR